MALLRQEDVAPEGSDEARENVIADALVDNAPAIPGVRCVRNVSPLVMSALQRANNPYVTAKKGFDAIGVSFDETGNQLIDAAEFAVVMMPKTAEVAVLLSCDRNALKRYAVDPAALQDAALDFMECTTMEKLAEITVYISTQLLTITKTRATPAPDEKPPDSAVKGGGSNRPKKHARTGKHKS